MADVLPVISLSPDNSIQSLAEALYKACTGAGFFYVVDHGIPEETIKAAFNLSREFFLNTDDQEKFAYNFATTSGLGYSGLGRETLDATLTKGDLKESFYLARFKDNEQSLPPTLQAKKDLLTNLQDRLEAASIRVVSGLAVALGLKEEAFTSCHNGGENRLRMIHYPPVTGSTEAVDIRASQHSDYGSITLLLTEGVGGLQVKQKDGSWGDVPHKPGALIVNIADALEFWSGGVLNSTLHQVVMPRNQQEAVSRFSIAYFVQPDFDTTLQVMTKSSDFSDDEFDKRVALKGIKAGTRRLTSGEFLKARLAATYS